MQTITAVYFWKLGQQMLFSKALAGWTTTPDAKLFTIRLDIAKTTSMDIEYIILITDFPGSARKAVGPSIHPEHMHSLVIWSVLRLSFSCSINYRIEFQDCPSNAKWSLHQLVHNDVTNTKVATRLHPAISINTLHSKSV